MSRGLIVNWWMKGWWILSTHQTLATPNFHNYSVMYIHCIYQMVMSLEGCKVEYSVIEFVETIGFVIFVLMA